MKYLYFFLVFTTLFSCNAQNIVPIYNGPIDTPPNPYFKDVDNDFDSIIGEWKWEEGNNSWTIQLQKVEMVQYGSEFEDSLFGEYQYISDGVELVNELPLIPNNNDELVLHNLWGGNISTSYPDTPPCDICPTNTRYIILSVRDPSRPGLAGEVIFAQFIEGGVEKMRLRLSVTENTNYLTNPNYNGPDFLSMPEGDYTFIKQ